MSHSNHKKSWFSGFNSFVEKYCPDALVFAVILTIIILVLSQFLTDTSFQTAMLAWGEGLHGLLAFTAQVAFTIIAAYVLAHTRAVTNLLSRLASLPQTTWQAYVLVTLFSGLFSLILWPLGLIAGGLIAKEVAHNASDRGIPVHYPLLVAAAFGGFIVWHMGYSSTIGLALATPGNPLESQVGGVIPVTETLLSWWNITTIFVTLAVISLTIVSLHPKNSVGLPRPQGVKKEPQKKSAGARTGMMGFLENSRITSWFLATLIFTYLGFKFSKYGMTLTLDIVNWSFLALGLYLVNSSRHYVRLFSEGAHTGAAILLQYPLYGGIMGIMLASGLTQKFSEFIIQNSSAATLPFLGFFSAGLINIAIPSGGAQWALQGPIFIEAAKAFHVDIRIIAMSIAWGDQWTNIIQPFCAIPLLAITGVKLRQIYAYCMIMVFTTSFAFVLGLYLAITGF